MTPILLPSEGSDAQFFSQLVAVVLFTFLSYLFEFAREPYNIKVLGAMDASLPAMTLPSFQLANLRVLVQPALITAVISYMVTISIAQSFASKHNYVVNANQELVALGEGQCYDIYCN